MKNKLIIILTVFFLLGCKLDKKTSFYPSKNAFGNKKAIQINKMSSKELVRRYNRFDYSEKNDTLYFYNLENEIEVKKIAIYPRSIGLIRTRNRLLIEKDSVFFSHKGFEIEKIDSLLKPFYFNKAKEYWLSDSPEKAFVMIGASTYQRKGDLEEVMLRLIKSFDDLNSKGDIKLELKIVLETPIPGPPVPL